jgi:arylsulfatase A-like enzyme
VNIILLISDTFRYDNLFDRAAAGPMGMPVRTPKLDAFSRRAVSLSRLYTSSFPTIPHRTDLTSGRFGWPWHGWQDLAKSTENHLPRILAAGGTKSQLICDCPHLFNSGFHRGFTAAVRTRGQEGDNYFLHLNDPVTHAMDPAKTRREARREATLVDMHRWQNASWRHESDRFAPRTAQLAVEWLEDNYRFDPLFLWVDWFDPHEPWDPPEYMVRRYDPRYDGPPMLHPNYGKSTVYTKAELRNLRAHYCAEAEMVDRAVGRVLQKIDDLGLWDSSIVIFTTDHGFSIGERNRTGKTNISPADKRYWPLYPEIAHIPLMIAAPGLQGGRTVGEIIQVPDILPTILELAGRKGAETPEPLHGRSFAPLLRGRRGAKGRAFAVTATCNRPDEKGRIAKRSETPGVYTKKWAYYPIGAAGRPELYDLAADGYCRHSVAADHANVCKAMHRRLLGFLRDHDAPDEMIQLYSEPAAR